MVCVRCSRLLSWRWGSGAQAQSCLARQWCPDGLTIPPSLLVRADQVIGERDTDARLWHPWLRINRVLRVMLHTHWSARTSASTLCATRSLAGSCRTASAYTRSSGYSGHRSLAMTLRYGRLAPESQRHAVAKLNGMLGRRTTAAPGHKQSTRESAPQNREPAADRPHVRRPRGAGEHALHAPRHDAVLGQSA
jgi:hypothetical protein